MPVTASAGKQSQPALPDSWIAVPIKHEKDRRLAMEGNGGILEIERKLPTLSILFQAKHVFIYTLKNFISVQARAISSLCG
jgi:hypothetical protein